IENRVIAQLGGGIIQSSQSPLGQINGVVADLTRELWELAEEVYGSYDPAQAEGSRLDQLGHIRLIQRNGRSDGQYRQILMNEGVLNFGTADFQRSLQGVPGVTFSHVSVEDTGDLSPRPFEDGVIAACVIGGDENQVAEVIRRFVVPGITTYGNVRVQTEIEGISRSVSILRPTEVAVSGTIRIKDSGRNGIVPSATTVKSTVVNGWAARRINGLAVTDYHIRSIIEAAHPAAEFVSWNGTREGTDSETQVSDVEIPFIEIASIAVDDLEVQIGS
ncbi:MAG: hypothetical protein AAF220_01710, partial [Pseudomonadota bacterium]